jgi:hypothetical protein
MPSLYEIAARRDEDTWKPLRPTADHLRNGDITTTHEPDLDSVLVSSVTVECSERRFVQVRCSLRLTPT